MLKIRHGGDLADEAVLQQLRNLGYIGEAAAPTSGAVAAAAGPPPAAARAGGAPWWWTGKARLTALCGLALLSAYGLGTLFPSLERYAFLAALAVGLIPIASRAFSAARHGTPFSIEMLMTIAAVGAVFIGAAEEAAAVVLLFLVGEMLEGVAAGRARKSIQGLAALVPKTAFVEADGVTNGGRRRDRGGGRDHPGPARRPRSGGRRDHRGRGRPRRGPGDGRERAQAQGRGRSCVRRHD